MKVIFAKSNFCNCNSIGICTASRFKVQLPLLYTAWSSVYSEIGPEVRCDLSRLLARKITKRIHCSKPASLNRPIACLQPDRPSFDPTLTFPSLQRPKQTLSWKIKSNKVDCQPFETRSKTHKMLKRRLIFNRTIQNIRVFPLFKQLRTRHRMRQMKFDNTSFSLFEKFV